MGRRFLFLSPPPTTKGGHRYCELNFTYIKYLEWLQMYLKPIFTVFGVLQNFICFLMVNTFLFSMSSMLKKRSSEMEEGIKVVSIKGLFKSNNQRGKKSYFVNGSVHNLHLKDSAPYQVCNLNKQGTVVFFYSHQSSHFGITLFVGKPRINPRNSKVTTVVPLANI